MIPGHVHALVPQQVTPSFNLAAIVEERNAKRPPLPKLMDFGFYISISFVSFSSGVFFFAEFVGHRAKQEKGLI
jgi:hypothetical protein